MQLIHGAIEESVETVLIFAGGLVRKEGSSLYNGRDDKDR